MRVAIIVLIVSFLLVLCVPRRTVSYVRAETPPPCDVELNTEESITLCIKDLWRADSDVAIAVAKAESGLNPNAINYNCRYNGKSTFCKKGDLTKAWSCDVSVFQINVSCGTKMTTRENIMKAYEMYQKRGWQPWVAYNDKKHLVYLD